MLRFQPTAPLRFQRFGLELFCCLLFLFTLALPFTRLGSWNRDEPVAVGLSLLAAIAAGWAGLGMWRGWLTVRRPLHPVLVALLCWAALQLLPFFTSPLPLMSWFGPPHIGEGGASQIAWVLSIIVASAVWEQPRNRPILLACAGASLAIMAWLHFDLRRWCDPMAGTDEAYYLNGASNPWAPANWPDYLAFGAAWFWVAYAATPSTRSPARLGWAVIICSIALWISANNVGILLLFPALVVSLLALILRRHLPRFLGRPSRFMKMVAVFLMLVPLSWIAISQNSDLFTCKTTSTSSRALYQQASVSQLRDTPSSLAFGDGWGFFFHDILSHGAAQGAWVYHNGIYDPSDLILTHEMMVRAAYHPHSNALNHLRALGVAGLVVGLLIPILCLWRLPRARFWWCAPVWVGSVMMGYFWFPLPIVVGLHALAIAALCVASRADNSAALPRPAAISMLLLSLVLAATAYQQARLVLYGVSFWPVQLHRDAPMPKQTSWMADDNAYGSFRLAFAAEAFSRALAKKPHITEADAAWFEAMLHASATAANSANATLLQRANYSYLLMELLFTHTRPSPLDRLKPAAREALLPAILQLSEAAPKREDLIAPFLLHLDAFNDHNKAVSLAALEAILEKAPNHRSALYLKGQLLASEPDQAAHGKALMEKAISQGVAQIYPLPAHAMPAR